MSKQLLCCVNACQFPTDGSSATVQLGQTHVLAAVSSELGEPRPGRPLEGSIHFNVDFSPMASPAFESDSRHPGDGLIQRLVERNFFYSKALDLEALCVVAGSLVRSSCGKILCCSLCYIVVACTAWVPRECPSKYAFGIRFGQSNLYKETLRTNRLNSTWTTSMNQFCPTYKHVSTKYWQELGRYCKALCSDARVKQEMKCWCQPNLYQGCCFASGIVTLGNMFFAQWTVPQFLLPYTFVQIL